MLRKWFPFFSQRRSGETSEIIEPEASENSEEDEIPQGPIQLEIRDVLDLHTFAPRDIAAVVEAYLEEARVRGFSSVRIIHGKGTGAQRAQVRSLLRRTPSVAAFEDAPLEAGSWGATVVWFRPSGE
ncbi:MAG: Smr/MutS family protein [Acidobacteria bacterium]|nr:Smr/MutS family protein [Acidobacteriota bacterium]